MPTAERTVTVMEVLPEQTARIRASDSLKTQEFTKGKNIEPTAEVLGKMSELSFQKHGGQDNSTMYHRL